jgi:hypothetical protein
MPQKSEHKEATQAVVGIVSRDVGDGDAASYSASIISQLLADAGIDAAQLRNGDELFAAVARVGARLREDRQARAMRREARQLYGRGAGGLYRPCDADLVPMLEISPDYNDIRDRYRVRRTEGVV